jgi:hypothetical protein
MPRARALVLHQLGRIAMEKKEKEVAMEVQKIEEYDREVRVVCVCVCVTMCVVVGVAGVIVVCGGYCSGWGRAFSYGYPVPLSKPDCGTVVVYSWFGTDDCGVLHVFGRSLSLTGTSWQRSCGSGRRGRSWGAYCGNRLRRSGEGRKRVCRGVSLPFLFVVCPPPLFCGHAETAPQPHHARSLSGGGGEGERRLG